MTAPLIFLTAAEVAQVLRIDPRTAVRMCRDGELKASRPGKAWLVAESDLIAHVEAHSNQQEQATA